MYSPVSDASLPSASTRLDMRASNQKQDHQDQTVLAPLLAWRQRLLPAWCRNTASSGQWELRPVPVPDPNIRHMHEIIFDVLDRQ